MTERNKWAASINFYYRCQTIIVIIGLVSISGALDSQAAPLKQIGNQGSQSTRITEPPKPVFALRVAPLPLNIRHYQGDILFRLDPSFTFGPNFAVYRGGLGNMFFPTREGYSLGALINYHFGRSALQTGLYSSFQSSFDDYTSSGHPRSKDTIVTGYSLHLLFGYEFVARTGFMFSIAGGVRYHGVSGIKREVRWVDDGTHAPTGNEEPFASSFWTPDIEAKVGWAF